MCLSRVLFVAAAGALCMAGAARADTDCSEPVSEWKSRDVLRQQVEQGGWTVQRIKVDDGCYEVRGTDRLGNKVKAKYGPASLKLYSLSVEFGPTGDSSDYLRPARPGPHRRGPHDGAPTGTHE